MIFDEKSHEYDGGKYRSVTQFLNQFQKPFQKELIASRVAKRDNREAQEIIDEWDTNARMARDFGNAIDGAIHYWVEFNQKPKHPFLEKVVNEFEKLSPEREKINSQIIVANDELGIAGTPDQLYSTGKKKVILRDIKTYGEMQEESKYFFLDPISHIQATNVNKARLQLSTYREMLEREGIKVEKLEIWHYNTNWDVIEVDPIDINPLIDYQPKTKKVLKI